MTLDPDAIADCVLATFDQLPDKRKPRSQTNGAREWVPLAGIVLADKDGKLSCISLGTGMKCLPSSKLPLAKGNALHDWHAEVLAIRAFNRFLLDELLFILTPPHPESTILRPRREEERTPTSPQAFTIREDVQLHMYCSEAPCGDASMELTMSLQEDATPWTTPVSTVTSTSDTDTDAARDTTLIALRGRSHFSHLGLVRCKPSRPDAPPTLSKSCTDKLTLTQATSLLSALPSLLISPRNVYLRTLTLPASQHIPSAVARAFAPSGRMRTAVEKAGIWSGGYAWHSFAVHSTRREFRWSRRMVPSGVKATASNLSAVWTAAWQETLIGGVLQGRKQFDARGASAICRRSVWKVALQIAGIAGMPAVVEALGRGTYKMVKDGEMLEARRRVKRDVRRQALQGWVKNTGDDEFAFEDDRSG
ncbi:adenosine-deaminase [Bimuria novae-zelandiae CBS 107.79]|uniref:Adenosine-deaminase n=1 Tax=Bimuria novae-zelandiae CBS 107.79 TaxID=1447943 RepID=A0A6A5V381_9PLEO|nr:adenosine-deaminase [Bimuria novae-zelandiae CBS 107.79]